MAELFVFFQVFFLAMMSPGPNYALLLSASRRFTRTHCTFVVLGITLGEFFWASCALFGVSIFIVQWPWLRFVLLSTGALFLGFLGLMSLISAWRQHQERKATTEQEMRKHEADLIGQKALNSKRKALLFGLVYMLLNGKAALFWISLTQVILPADLRLQQRLIVVFSATALSFLWHFSLARLMTSARARRLFLRLGLWLDALLGTLFLILALLGLYSGLSPLFAA